ncbi:hypothetical protein HHK36_010992 [Tetracentron sinense]|uniref:Uncharacterized protein n=1 Tax=Tetracentron sinense TaxID=13715 RepID=A0A834ZBK7_TETSI|nr:hypothetical protein HHK36_010992 [Tetracentron sinense]
MAMSNSEPFLAEKDPKAIEFEFLSRPMLEFLNGCQIAASEDHQLHRLDEEQKQEEEKCQITVFSSEELKMAILGEFKVDNDENGFLTSTSLDHKMQEEEKCQITVSRDLEMATLGEFKVEDGFRTPTFLDHKSQEEVKCQITVSSEDLEISTPGEFKDDNGFRTPTSLDHKIQEEEKKEEKCQITVSYGDLKMATLGEFKVDDDDDGFRTPTSLDHKIQVKQCPSAPRKPKSLPSTKRKASSNFPQQIRMDLKDFESLFPPAPLIALGRKLKRVRGGGGGDTE